MKTFKELFDEIANSEELKKAYETAVKSGDAAVEAFLKENGCEATAEDIRNFFKEQQEERELSSADMAGVAGGTFLPDGGIEPGLSSMMPWQCDPHYSDVIHNGGYICG